MKSPLFALTWELYSRRRWPLLLTLASVVLLPLLALLSGVRHPNVFGGVILLLIPGVVLLADLCVGGEGPLDGRASLFPRRLFRLPVPAWVLVAPPLLLGTTVLVVGGTILTLTLPPLRNLHSPGLWPGPLAAVCLAWFQALCWSPFPLRWLRAVALCLLVPVVIFTAVAFSDLPAGVPEIVLLPLLGLAYFVAYCGVGLARRGVGLDEPAPAAALAPSRKRKPFASAFAAQTWLEWRQARAGLVVLGASLLWLVPVLLWLPTALRDLESMPPVKTAVEVARIHWLVVAVPLLVPLYAALFLGPGLGLLRWRRNRVEMASFLSSKPIDSALLLRVKLWFLARVMAGASALMVLVALLWALTTGGIAEMAERLTSWCGGPVLAVLALIAGPPVLAALAWLWAAGGLWSGLWGRWWAGPTALVATLTFASALVTGPAWVAGLALGCNAGCMIPLLRHSRLWPLIVGLIVAAVASASLGWWLVAVLLWPWPGLLIAPAALARNRHR